MGTRNGAESVKLSKMHVSLTMNKTRWLDGISAHSGIDKMRERRSQAPFEFLQAHFKILTF